MFESFFLGLQQDIKLFLFFPILSAIFRIAFINIYQPYPSFKGRGKALLECFRYGFWWGMDFNAYVFLASMILVSIPSAFFDFFQVHGLALRLGIGVIYAAILYAAFMGKMIFYRHFHDTFNYLVHMGKHAEKHNLVDVFFHQDHGVLILLGYIPYVPAVLLGCWILQQIPSIGLPHFNSTIVQYIFNTGIFLLAILGFYWVRFGGTLNHRNKPEWDTIPSIVKEDAFLARACVDDLVALKWVRRKPLAEEMQQSDETLAEHITKIMPEEHASDWQSLKSPLLAYQRVAQGPKISKPRHVFFIVGESVPQWALDPLYAGLHVLDATKRFIANPHTMYFNHFLPAGNISRPSIVSLMTGIYDAQLELNEMEAFWYNTVPTSFAGQMKELGYQTIYWYGGNASNGNFNHFGRAQGFDRVDSATDFCGPQAPRTWVGVYDHVFLQEAAKRIKEIQEPTFHFIYTTSNHGPYKIEPEVLKFDKSIFDESIGSDIRDNEERCKALGTARYADQAVNHFIDEIREAFPDSLILYTGDHSSLYAELGNSSLVPRDYMFRELYCTPLVIHHPQLSTDWFAKAEMGTHLNIIPTVLELIAPKGFTYYSLYPSLMQTQPEYLVTPKQWMTENEVGEVMSGMAERQGEASREVREKYKPAVGTGCALASDYVSLTAWLIRHADSCLEKNEAIF